MFGYIRPMQGELKVREFERFKACYCGLCHALGKKYGVVARFILSYELVFLAMLLWGEDEPVKLRRGRCVASPCRSKCYCTRSSALDICAGYNVILVWWKLHDTIADERFIRAIPHRLLTLVLSRAYKKAAREFPEFDARVREEVVSLNRYESGGEKSLDGAADRFAKILSAAVPDGLKDTARRPILQLLYHLGRWIYLVDACDDYYGDVKAGRYNPIAQLYPPEHGKLDDDSLARLNTTLAHSNNLICSAFELLPENDWSKTVSNIIYLGMPDVCARVLRGEWFPRRLKQIRKGIDLIHE